MKMPCHWKIHDTMLVLQYQKIYVLKFACNFGVRFMVQFFDYKNNLLNQHLFKLF